MKRLGPELKMPDLGDLKVPAVISDVYLDLRDRRLLPLIALVVVAIVAVPFLLGEEAEPLPPPSALGQSGNAAQADASSFTVVEATPGLRAPGKRLDERDPTNPFKQRYTSLPKAAQLQSTDAGEPVGEVTVDISDVEGTVVPGSTGGSAGGGGSGGAASPPSDGARYFSYRPDIRFGVAGSDELGERKELPIGTTLPERVPVAVFLGVSENGGRALFHISPEVAMVQGDGHCVGGPQSCGMLWLKEGEAADLLTGKPNRAFRLKVEKIEWVEIDSPKPSSSPSPKRAPRAAWAFDMAAVGQSQK